MKKDFPSIKIMRDPTRGGLATVLHEFSSLCKLAIHLIEEDIPIIEKFKAMNKFLGLDPLYMACEVRMVLVVKESEAQKVLNIIQSIKHNVDFINSEKHNSRYSEESHIVDLILTLC